MKLIRFLRDWLRTFRDPDAPDAELEVELWKEDDIDEAHGVEFTFRLDYLLIAVLLGIIVWQLSSYL